MFSFNQAREPWGRPLKLQLFFFFLQLSGLVCILTELAHYKSKQTYSLVKLWRPLNASGLTSPIRLCCRYLRERAQKSSNAVHSGFKGTARWKLATIEHPRHTHIHMWLEKQLCLHLKGTNVICQAICVQSNESTSQINIQNLPPLEVTYYFSDSRETILMFVYVRLFQSARPPEQWIKAESVTRSNSSWQRNGSISTVAATEVDKQLESAINFSVCRRE